MITIDAQEIAKIKYCTGTIDFIDNNASKWGVLCMGINPQMSATDKKSAIRLHVVLCCYGWYNLIVMSVTLFSK